MIKVFCAKRIVEKLPRKPKACKEEVKPLEQWCVNLLFSGSWNFVVAMSADTRFGFVIANVDQEKFEKLPELLAEGIRKAFAYYGIRKEIMDDYLSEPPVLYGSARVDRSTWGKLISVMKYVEFLALNKPTSDAIPIEYIALMNRRSVSVGGKDGYHPRDGMLEALQAKYQMKPISSKAFELTATMDLQMFVAKRVLEIPVSYTFQDLHKAFQGVMRWDNCHPYKFVVADKHICGSNDERNGEHDVPAKDTLLSDCLKEGDEFTYLYDFENGWKVSIKVTNTFDGYDLPRPRCVEAERAAPPENVGGISGFVKFWEAYNNPDYPNRDALVKGFTVGWDPEPDIEHLNYRLIR